MVGLVEQSGGIPPGLGFVAEILCHQLLKGLPLSHFVFILFDFSGLLLRISSFFRFEGRFVAEVVLGLLMA